VALYFFILIIYFMYYFATSMSEYMFNNSFATLRIQVYLRLKLSMFDCVSLPELACLIGNWGIFFRQLACTKYQDFITCDEGTAEEMFEARFCVPSSRKQCLIKHRKFKILDICTSVKLLKNIPQFPIDTLRQLSTTRFIESF